MPRMRILSASEQACLDRPPVLDSLERKRFFTFSKSQLETASRMRRKASQIGFLLMCGYFRAARKFFSSNDFHARDIAYVAHLMGISPDDFQPRTYKDTTRLRHQRIILGFYGFRPFDGQVEAILAQEIAKMTRGLLKPRLIFGRCLDFSISTAESRLSW